MATNVHPTAIVDARAILGDDVEVGPYCLVGPNVVIGARTRLISHVQITGKTSLGEDNLLYPFAVIGAEPQDVSYRGTETRVVIGSRNTFREHVTVHRATEKEIGVTSIDDDSYFMVGCHVAHDCVIGSNVWLANQTALSGHVQIEDHAAISGMVGVHHFCTVGAYSFVGGCSKIVTDVPPFMLVDGNPSEVRNVNLVGLRRRGFSNSQIRSLSTAYKLLFRDNVGVDAARAALIADDKLDEHVVRLMDFIDQVDVGRVGRRREKKRFAA
jgi:UDP-N-acetylglucosamine acyltransferase